MNNQDQLQSLFPIGLPVIWQQPSQLCQTKRLSAQLENWLLDTGSLTARLQQECRHFRVELLGQAVATCSAEEACADIQAGEQVIVREVVLYCDEQPQVFARSLLPLTSLTGQQQALASLGEQSLGQVLFNSADLVRKAMELTWLELAQAEQLSALVEKLNLPKQQAIAGRRSVFLLNNKPLLVAELFLPNAFAYSALNSCS